MLKFCNKENKNKELIILLERTIARVSEALGKSEWTVKNTHKDLRMQNEWGKYFSALKNSACKKEISMNGFEKCV
jgi:hypothetical protein